MRYPSGECSFRRDGALSVGVVRIPPGWCNYSRADAFTVGIVRLSVGSSVFVLGYRTNKTHFKDLVILNFYLLGFRNIGMLKSLFVRAFKL